MRQMREPCATLLLMQRALDVRGNPLTTHARHRDQVILEAADTLALLDGQEVHQSHRTFLVCLQLHRHGAGAGECLSSSDAAAGPGAPAAGAKCHLLQPPRQLPAGGGGFRVVPACRLGIGGGR
jgi:hypothetical protein